MSETDGTPEARFVHLMEELDRRFHDPNPFLSSRTPERYYLTQIDDLRQRVKDLEYLYDVINSPTGDAGKFNYLMNALQKRFGYGENNRTREEIDAIIGRIDGILREEEHY